MTLGNDLRVAAEEADARDAAIVKAEQQHDADVAKIGDLNTQVATLTQKLADCEGETPPPEPPPTTTTDFGACPTKGGNASQVPTKWGKGAALRTFASSGSFTAPAPVIDVGTWHHSWKPTIGTAMTTASVTAAIKNARAGDFVEVWHEVDVKVNGGSLSAADAESIKKMKATFYDVVKAVRPDLRVAHTVSAWLFNDASGEYPGTANNAGTAEWHATVKADVIGIDCDGMSNLSKYPDFSSSIKNVRAFIAAKGFDGWAVPEFIHPRISSDPTGTQRAQFFTTHGIKFRDGDADYVTLFDYNYRPNQEVIVGSPEFTAWKSFI